jgi:predicted nucleic acid-binding protein
MQVLVDTSVWINYFRGGNNSGRLDYLLDENLPTINDLILAELVPFLKMKNQRRIISLLNEVTRLPLNIHWNQIIDYQYRCLKAGINGIGIPDLIIAQNASQHQCALYSLDNHFKLMTGVVHVTLME